MGKQKRSLTEICHIQLNQNLHHIGGFSFCSWQSNLHVVIEKQKARITFLVNFAYTLMKLLLDFAQTFSVLDYYNKI